MKKRMLTYAIAAVAIWTYAAKADACTGITVKTTDGKTVVARTIEWGSSDLNSRYVVVPHGYRQQSYVPGGEKEGLEFTARYGYIGLAVEKEEFVTEGLNEAGLSAGLFYFPGYGGYEDFRTDHKDMSLSDLQLVPWMLGCFRTVGEVIDAIKHVHVVAVDPRASTAHWRIADATGRQVVLEITGGKPHFFENKLGVLTNSPGFEWQLTNLNNYVNLFPGAAEAKTLGSARLSPFGAGSGFLGLPGDITPPSRFVRAAFYQATAPKQPTAEKAVLQCFQILNNFDIPVGIEFPENSTPPDIPSATQWTSATDIAGGKLYYRTMRNSTIRCFDLKTIDFGKVKYQSAPLDSVKEQPVATIAIR